MLPFLLFDVLSMRYRYTLLYYIHNLQYLSLYQYYRQTCFQILQNHESVCKVQFRKKEQSLFSGKNIALP